MLTDEQKREFKREGYVIIEDGVDEELAKEGRDIIRDGIPYDLDDKEALLEAEDNSAYGEWVEAEEPFRTINEQLYEYGRELVGDALVPPDEPDIQISCRFPNDIHLAEYGDRVNDGEYLDGPHLDGFSSPETGYSGWTVAGVVFFQEEDRWSGGFELYPRSHWVAAKFFEDRGHPLHAGCAGWVAGIDDDNEGWNLSRTYWKQVRAHCIEGTPGTVVLMHGNMIHGAGVNQTSDVRIAGIKRMSRHDYDDIKIDAADKPFKYWDGMEDIHVDVEC